MNKEDTVKAYDYMITVYRSYRPQISKQQDLVVWYTEFLDMSFDEVLAALRKAMSESPQWAPTTQQIKDAYRVMKEQARRASPEQNFKDTHCGKTKEEWERLIAWEQTEERLKRFQEARERIKAICGG